MTANNFPILGADGEVKYNRMDPVLLESLKLLPLQHDRYFVVSPTTLLLPVSMLVFSRARPEGVANANILMREAAAGHHSRRAPIRVRELDDGRWHVIDGNSTALNALFSDWPDIPADVDRS
jgi:hypothetical protein